MKYEKDIATQIISNIALIESSLMVIKDVEETIFSEFNKVIEKCVEESDISLGKDNAFSLYHDSDALYFSTKDWENEDQEQVACYYMDYGKDDGAGELYHLTHLLGEHSKNASLHLKFYMDKDLLGINRKEYKANLNALFLQSQGLSDLGFKLSSCNQEIEITFHLDKEVVAEEYPDLDKSFDPVKEAFNTLFKAHPYFEELVKEMKRLISSTNQ